MNIFLFYSFYLFVTVFRFVVASDLLLALLVGPVFVGLLLDKPSVCGLPENLLNNIINLSCSDVDK